MTEETKPVAWIPDWELPLKTKTMVYDRNHDEGYVPLYTHPPKPESVDPVAWIYRKDLEEISAWDATVYGRGGFDDAVPLYTHPPKPESVEPVAYIPTNPADGIEWVKPIPQWGTPLYTQPPTVQAAVSAALRKAAEVCLDLEKGKWEHVHDTLMKGGSLQPKSFIDAEKSIRALPHDDSALRELMIRAVVTGQSETWMKPEQVVDRVLGEGK
jgi:hypothetical protein